MLTIKSDDVVGRNKTYEAIIKNQHPKMHWLPESFNYLTYILKWLCQDVQSISKEDMDQYNKEKIDKIQSLNLSWITGSFLATLEDTDSVVIDTGDKSEIIENILKDLEEWGSDTSD
jgi:hypothetical protein